MAIFYNLHFANYNLGKNRVVQFIIVSMWKQLYINYQMTYLNSYLVEETLKHRLRNILKELKIGISNEEGLNKTTLQCDQVLEYLKAIDGHATRNVLKRHQSLINGGTYT